jgi:hypothetical protein
MFTPFVDRSDLVEFIRPRSPDCALPPIPFINRSYQVFTRRCTGRVLVHDLDCLVLGHFCYHNIYPTVDFFIRRDRGCIRYVLQ